MPTVNSSPENLSRFDDNLRRISTVLFGAGMLVVVLIANSQMVKPYLMHRTALNCLVIAAGISVVAVMLFPWHRYDRNLFLIVALDGLSLITLSVYFSGGGIAPLRRTCLHYAAVASRILSSSKSAGLL